MARFVGEVPPQFAGVDHESRVNFAAKLVNTGISLAAALLLSVSPIQAAPSLPLQDARNAIAQVKYDRAQKLLVAAIDAGGLQPEQLVDAYVMSGIVAVVLGQPQTGERYFQLALLLDPVVTLPSGSAPKLTEAFTNAKAGVLALGQLNVKLRQLEPSKDQSSAHTMVIVDQDPMSLARSAELRSAGKPVVVSDSKWHIAAPVGPHDVVAILDQHGNALLLLDSKALLVDRPIAKEDSKGRSTFVDPDEPSVLRQWPLWTGVVTASAGASIALGLTARHYESKRDDALRGGSPFYPSIRADDERARSYATLTNIALVATGALAVTGAILVLSTAKQKTVVTPTADDTSIGVSFSSSW
jgi:hypothetical protein